MTSSGTSELSGNRLHPAAHGIERFNVSAVVIMWPLRGSHPVVVVNGHRGTPMRGAGEQETVPLWESACHCSGAILRVENLLPWELEGRAMKKMGLRLFLNRNNHTVGQQNLVRAFWLLSFPQLQPEG